jgi:transcription-repair coupling factor (superfamily II helicase)
VNASPTRLTDLAARLAARTAPARLVGLRGAARAVAIARLVEAHAHAPALVVAIGSKAADALLEDLRLVLGEPPPDLGGRVRLFPAPDTTPYDRFSPQPFVVAQRMEVLHRLAVFGQNGANGGAPPIFVAPWTALAPRVPARVAVLRASLGVARGKPLDRDAFVAALLAAGYARQSVVEERGEVAVRGGVVDFFPPHLAKPVRIELFGDEVESLREFDPASQRSQAELERVVAPPPRELLVTRELAIERGDRIRSAALAQGVAARDVDLLLDSLLRGSIPAGAEAIAPLIQPALETIFDLLPEDALIVVDEPELGHDRLLRFSGEVIENHDGARQAGRLVCDPDALYVGADALLAEVARRRAISLERLEVASPGAETVKAFGHDELAASLRAARGEPEPLAPLVRALGGFAREGMRIVIAAHALSGAERTRMLLGEYGVASTLTRELAPHHAWSAPGAIEVRVADLSEGFVLADERLVVLTEEECFGPREKRRPSGSSAEGFAIESLGQLSPGDYLVHAEHGIGVYRGLVLLDVGRTRDEFLRIEYAGGDKLFVPVHRLSLVTRFVGNEGALPPVDKLGGATWEKTKSGVRRKVRDMARQLLAVHAARELAPGFAFPPRDRALEEFEARFPYEETPDQLGAIDDVLSDLAQARPADRLVCGDVGYGKTEVAIRAAHQVIMAGKQVAVLVPTTVLCQQHVETFQKRFEGLPATIESLSRFDAPKDAAKTLEGLASGRIDIVVGTHRLLQKNVAFHDLGLLVIDEEHRFGVAHKERIKELKQTVDVVTLTATPIPRTLQMAFSGLRDMSVIQTPPPNRIAIRTQVCRFDESLIREAILRETRRGGQVFFVHNRVQTIGNVAELLARIVPEARVIVAHGQMPERALEDKTYAFFHGKADVLLSTTIIESGVDVPRANTILIDRADALGLAQLYQLRGRVGRSSQRAYAYLLIPGDAALTSDARRRLEAIQDLSALGSGFRLANMDLEIRGAGNLLGAEQSGNLGAVGYETYMELLSEAVDELRGKQREAPVDPEIRLGVAARLPEAYVADVQQRLVLYKRLASAPDDAEADRLRDELLDRFGPLPREAENLLAVIHLKIAARTLGIAQVLLDGAELVFTAAPSTRVDPTKLHKLVTRRRADLRVMPDQRIRAQLAARDPASVFARAREVLGELGGA